MANLRDLLITIFLISSQILSQNLETKLIKGLPSNLNPGSINSIVFRILNQNDYSASLNVKLNAPASWRLFYNDSVTVQKNSVSILPIGVKVPLATIPGLYQIFLDLNNSEINFKKVINVDTHIRERIDIEVKLVDAPKFVLAGKDILKQ